MSDAPELQMSDGQMASRIDGQTNDGATTSTGQAAPVAPAGRENRRSVPRRRVERLAYIRFDKDNGGILLDIGEGGLKFQGVASSLEGEFCIVKFMLPGSGRTIEVRGQIAWSNKSRKGGGVRFVDIPEDVRQQIREWMAQENMPLISARPVAKPIVSKPPQFLTREKVKAGMTPLSLDQPVMPSLSSVAAVESVAPVAPSVLVAAVPVAEVRAEDRAVVSSLPTESTIPAAKVSDAVVGSAKVEVPAVLRQSPISAPTGVSVPPLHVEAEPNKMPAFVAEDERTTNPTKSPPSRFRGITQPAATQIPAPVLAQTPQTSDWFHSATLPRSESFLAVDLAAAKYGKPPGSSRVAQAVVVAAFVCAAVAAAVVVTPRTPALLASFRGTSQASTSAPVDAPAPDAAAGQDFSVDAVDNSNRHSILRNGIVEESAVAAPESASTAASNVSPNAVGDPAGDVSSNLSNDIPGDSSSSVNASGSVSAAPAQPVEASRIVPAEPKIKAIAAPPAVQHLDLHPPKTRQVAVSSSGLEAPSVIENAPSANLLESRSLVPVAPSLPAPPPVAPVASAPAVAAKGAVSESALRPAVLIHSVRAIYPRDISLGKSGGSVRVSALIDKDGVPRSLTMVGGDPSLLEAAFAAVREYRYDPALLNGEPVESTVVIAVNFQQAK